MSDIIPPTPVDAPFGSYNWADWYNKVRLAINNATNTIPVTQGGTGLTTYTVGDTLYANASNILARLAIGTNGQFMQVVSGKPAWTTPGISATITTAKLTSLGANGSMTFVDGILTAQTPAT